MKKRVIWVIGTALVAVIALIGGIFLGKTGVRPVALPDSEAYPLLSRRVFVDNSKDPLINFSTLRTQLNDYFTGQNIDGGLYFEYLPTGTEVRVNGDEKNAAASLLKVPLAMEVYKAIELGKIKTDEKITLRPDDLDSGFGALYQKDAGYQLPVSEATRLMLIDSDNTALKALARTMDGVLSPTEGVFNFLDLEAQQQADQSIVIGTRSYSSILKCLYFTCYLGKDDSQKILDYLTQTSFNDRLVAGIPNKSIKVAHKIGVFQQKTQSDCGIVYLPTRPYILCVMIDGQDSEVTNHHIADLSRMVYDFVIKQ